KNTKLLTVVIERDPSLRGLSVFSPTPASVLEEPAEPRAATAFLRLPDPSCRPASVCGLVRRARWGSPSGHSREPPESRLSERPARRGHQPRRLGLQDLTTPEPCARAVDPPEHNSCWTTAPRSPTERRKLKALRKLKGLGS
ncbi:hypothetical protein MC885_005923, partial [Smutsia gigantea]